VKLSEKKPSFQEDVLSLQRQSEKLKSAMDEMVRINGAAKMNDYVALQSGLKENSMAISNQYEQSNFIKIWR
jgi:hypothetical protein